jgi:hypothetical protein
MNISAYNYLTLSGELRLLNISTQRWILNAGMHCESFNKFFDNTELMSTSLLLLPNGREYHLQRLNRLVEQAKQTAKTLNEILPKLDVQKNNVEEKKELEKTSQ